MDKNSTPTLSKTQQTAYVNPSLPAIDWSQPSAAQEAYTELMYQVQALCAYINNLNGYSGKTSFVIGGHTYTFTNGVLTNVV